ncbi:MULTISPECIES: hypothetical protein [Serratia]|uniref:hypothetical protein n=1 Tax=Serratia TaxID=613 RepID=UPI001E4221EB|nr:MULTISPECIES: hypothetical protein [Serratia]
MTAKLTEAGFWRKTADSSSLREPRVLIRVYVNEGEIDRAIAFTSSCTAWKRICVSTSPSIGWCWRRWGHF